GRDTGNFLVGLKVPQAQIATEVRIRRAGLVLRFVLDNRLADVDLAGEQGPRPVRRNGERGDIFAVELQFARPARGRQVPDVQPCPQLSCVVVAGRKVLGVDASLAVSGNGGRVVIDWQHLRSAEDANQPKSVVLQERLQSRRKWADRVLSINSGVADGQACQR